jgi:hypothetical protein
LRRENELMDQIAEKVSSRRGRWDGWSKKKRWCELMNVDLNRKPN